MYLIADQIDAEFNLNIENKKTYIGIYRDGFING